MVRPKGLGMPARRKRKVPEPQEECEVMDNSEDEDRLYGSASPSSSSTSSEPATRGIGPLGPQALTQLPHSNSSDFCVVHFKLRILDGRG